MTTDDVPDSVRISKEKLLSMWGHFYWGWGKDFYVETAEGNFLWSDPDYLGGTNEIEPTSLTYAQWLESLGVEMARDKGVHIIGIYCGNQVVLKQ